MTLYWANKFYKKITCMTIYARQDRLDGGN